MELIVTEDTKRMRSGKDAERTVLKCRVVQMQSERHNAS